MMKNLFSRTSENRLDELVFENRNKNYGAYVLRKDADAILTKSLVYGIGFFGLMAAIPLIISSVHVKPTIIDETAPPPFQIKNVEVKDRISPPAAILPSKPAAQFDSTVPEPVRNPKVEKPAAKITQYDNANAGFQNIEGEKPTVYTPPAVQGPTVVAPTVTAAPPAANPDAVADKVDVEANFNDGINAFRNSVQSNFDGSQFEGSGDILKTSVTFIVERDGTISNVKATGPDSAFNREAERSIRNIKGKWQPAKVQGQNVRSYFRFPISMRFE